MKKVCLKFEKFSSPKKADQQEMWQNLSKPILNNNFNKYKKELTKTKIDYIEKICIFEMKPFGYEPESKWKKLKKIEMSKMEKFHQQELKTYVYEPRNSVAENMQAKKRFYQHLR